MSIATPFRQDRPLPFCVEELSDSAIAALGYFAYDVTDLTSLMFTFWNLEEVRMGFGSPFVYEDVPMANPVTVDLSTPVAPRERVGFTEDYTAVGSTGFISTRLTAQTGVITDGTDEYILRFAIRGAKRSTDDGRYYLLLTVDICSDDGADALATTDTNHAGCTTLSGATLDFDIGSASIANYPFYQRGVGTLPVLTFNVSAATFYTYP